MFAHWHKTSGLVGLCFPEWHNSSAVLVSRLGAPGSVHRRLPSVPRPKTPGHSCPLSNGKAERRRVTSGGHCHLGPEESSGKHDFNSRFSSAFDSSSLKYKRRRKPHPSTFRAECKLPSLQTCGIVIPNCILHSRGTKLKAQPGQRIIIHNSYDFLHSKMTGTNFKIIPNLPPLF